MKPVRLMKPHPAAALFPLASDAELRELVEDIRQHGVRQPVVTYQGMLLDGRNRIRACDLLGADPPSVEYTENDPIGFVISANLKRRHMDDGQRALVAAKLANLRDGQRADQAAQICAPATDEAPPPVITQSQAADLLGVSRRTVQHAREVLDHGVPELVGAVERSEASVSAAATLAGLPVAEQVEAVRLGAVAAVAKKVRKPSVIDGEARREPEAAEGAGDGSTYQPEADRATAAASVKPAGPSRSRPAESKPQTDALSGADLIQTVRTLLHEVQRRAARPKKAAFTAIDAELARIRRSTPFRGEPTTSAEKGSAPDPAVYDERAAEIDDLRAAVDTLNERNTELDNENAGLREAIALANLPADEALTAKAVIDGLRAEVEALRKDLNTATATLKATTAGRDQLMGENAQMKRQIVARRREIEKLSRGIPRSVSSA